MQHLRKGFQHKLFKIACARRAAAVAQALVSDRFDPFLREAVGAAAHRRDIHNTADAGQRADQGIHLSCGHIAARAAAADIADADCAVARRRHAAAPPVAKGHRPFIGIEHERTRIRRGKRQIVALTPPHPAVRQHTVRPFQPHILRLLLRQ